jgi:pimeloyl-ACP methyl ester carboxylesterase
MVKILILIFMTLMSGVMHGQVPKKFSTLKVNGIDLYYEIHGQGEPLFLLHGWTQSSQFWSEYLARFVENYQVYTIDLRGHGRTTPLTEDFSIKKVAEDVLALLDHLNLKKIKAIGLSYGALVLLQLASVQPDKLESMVLIGASHQYSGGDNSDLDHEFSFDQLPSSFVKQLQEIHYYGDAQIKAMFDPNLNYEIRLGDKDLESINSRTLIINGDHDEIMGVNGAFALHKHLPNSYLWIVPNAGHIPIMDTNKTKFLDATEEFLKGKNK